MQRTGGATGFGSGPVARLGSAQWTPGCPLRDDRVWLAKRDVSPPGAFRLGARYHTGRADELDLQPDIVIECTGVAELILQSVQTVAPGGIICLTGVGPAAAIPRQDESLSTLVVLNNLVLFGSVNANRRHYHQAAKALARVDRAWLEQLITRRVDADDFGHALQRTPEDIKVVVEFRQA